MRAKGRYRLQRSNRGTRVTFSLQGKGSGLMRLRRRSIKKAIKGEVSSLDNLRRLLEERRDR